MTPNCRNQSVLKGRADLQGPWLGCKKGLPGTPHAFWQGHRCRARHLGRKSPSQRYGQCLARLGRSYAERTTPGWQQGHEPEAKEDSSLLAALTGVWSLGCQKQLFPSTQPSTSRSCTPVLDLVLSNRQTRDLLRSLSTSVALFYGKGITAQLSYLGNTLQQCLWIGFARLLFVKSKIQHLWPSVS